MIKTLNQLQTYLAGRRGFNAFTDMDAAERSVANDRLNLLRDSIWYFKQGWGFNRSIHQFTTTGAFTTGTVSGSAATNTVTGDTTGWPTNVAGIPLKGQFILINDKAYIILNRVSTTEITIEGKLLEELPAGTPYSILFSNYPMRWDIGAIRGVTRDITPIGTRPEEISTQDNDIGAVEMVSIVGQSNAEFDSGTGDLSNGSAVITNVAGLTLDDDSLIGKAIMNAGIPDIHYIIGVNDGASTITLDRDFNGTTVVTAILIVDPKGTPILQLKPFPVDRQLIRLSYTTSVPEMVGANDLTGLPNDGPMLSGIDVMVTSWETVGERGFINEVLFQDKKFKESMRILAYRGVELQRKMYLQQDRFVRANRFRDSNPWNRLRR